jgi:hypothetical protein
MKKTAFFILIIFMTVQVLPTIQSLWGNDNAIVLDISEEKKTEKSDIKSLKEFLSFYSISMDLSVKLLTQIHQAESILPSPCFEKLTPPPDFC